MASYPAASMKSCAHSVDTCICRDKRRAQHRRSAQLQPQRATESFCRHWADHALIDATTTSRHIYGRLYEGTYVVCKRNRTGRQVINTAYMFKSSTCHHQKLERTNLSCKPDTEALTHPENSWPTSVNKVPFATRCPYICMLVPFIPSRPGCSQLR